MPSYQFRLRHADGREREETLQALDDLEAEDLARMRLLSGVRGGEIDILRDGQTTAQLSDRIG